MIIKNKEMKQGINEMIGGECLLLSGHIQIIHTAIDQQKYEEKKVKQDKSKQLFPAHN